MQPVRDNLPRIDKALGAQDREIRTHNVLIHKLGCISTWYLKFLSCYSSNYAIPNWFVLFIVF